MLYAETLFTAGLTRQIAHFRRVWLEVLADCCRLRRHFLAEHRRLQPLRRRGDFWMLRFLRPGFNRWRELRRCVRLGLPKVDGQ